MLIYAVRIYAMCQGWLQAWLALAWKMSALASWHLVQLAPKFRAASQHQSYKAYFDYECNCILASRAMQGQQRITQQLHRITARCFTLKTCRQLKWEVKYISKLQGSSKVNAITVHDYCIKCSGGWTDPKVSEHAGPSPTGSSARSHPNKEFPSLKAAHLAAQHTRP